MKRLLGKKWVYGLLAIGLFWIFLTQSVAVSAETKKAEVSIFYNNACAACREDQDIEELYRQSVPLEIRERYQLRIYNVFQESSLEVYENLCEQTGVSGQSMEMPALHVQGKWLYGYEAIEKEAADLLKNGDADDGTEKNKEKETEKVDEKQPAAVNPELQDAWKTEQPLIVFFNTYSCEDCEKIKEYLEQIKEEHTVNVLSYNIAESDYVNMIKAWFQIYQVEDQEQQVPILFYGNTYRSGVDEITEHLEKDLEDGKAQTKQMRKLVEGYQGTAEEELPNLLVLFGSGFLAGFNPCSISMLLMLFSIILTARASVKKNGMLYLGGKYITYFLLGAGIYFAAAQITQHTLERAMGTVKMVLAVLFLVLAFMNFLDFMNVRKGEFGKVRMQLPKSLRKWNHDLIRKAGKMSGKLLPLLVLGLGIVISIGEFFCTGQIYMATILYLLKQGTENLALVITAFLIYVTAMCIPTVVFLVVIAKTRSTNRVSEFMLRRMDLVKLLNSILFICFALYFLIFG